MGREWGIDKVKFAIQRLQVFCGAHVELALRAHSIQKSEALITLKWLIDETKPITLQSIEELPQLIDCSLILLHDSLARRRVDTLCYSRGVRKVNRNHSTSLLTPYVRAQGVKVEELIPILNLKAESYFILLMAMLCPEQNDLVIEVVMRFLDSTSAWKVTYIAGRTLTLLLRCNVQPGVLLNKLLNYIQQVAKQDLEGARKILEVFFQTLFDSDWQELEAADLAQLIRLYHSSLAPEHPLNHLKMACEVCLRQLFALISPEELAKALMVMIPLALETNLKDNPELEFGNLVLLAIDRYRDAQSSSRIYEYVWKYLLESMVSTDSCRARLACRILARLMDDAKNHKSFLTPELFYFFTNYSINTHSLDLFKYKIYLKYRAQFDAAILAMIQRHEPPFIEAAYNLLCQLAVKSPNSIDATKIICLLVQIQEYAVTTQLDMVVSNRIHATVMSVMSLFSWLHRGSVLHGYVEKVTENRYYKAPHLLPPLQVI